MRRCAGHLVALTLVTLTGCVSGTSLLTIVRLVDRQMNSSSPSREMTFVDDASRPSFMTLVESKTQRFSSRNQSDSPCPPSSSNIHERRRPVLGSTAIVCVPDEITRPPAFTEKWFLICAFLSAHSKLIVNSLSFDLAAQ